MNITPRIKSDRNRQHLIVNFSIEIPLKQKYAITHRQLETSGSPSPNKIKKKHKLISTPVNDRKTMNTSNLNTLKDLAPSQFHLFRKKNGNTVPHAISARPPSQKYKSCELSSRKKGCSSRRSKEGTKIIRNVSILDHVISEDDTIIKYTTNSNELKGKLQDTEYLNLSSQKVETHISDVDIADMRLIEQHAKESKDRQYSVRANDILRTACAKKIQRAWRSFKTKKLIKSYSNDIRHKYSKPLAQCDEPLLSVRSQGTGLKFKKLINDEPSKPKSKLVKQFQEENIQKWEQIIQQIKQGKNIDNVLQKSLKMSEELKHELNQLGWEDKEAERGNQQKIIKTKEYYQKQRQKWKESERSGGSIIREQRINYFQNEILKIQNDLSDVSVESSKLSNSSGGQTRELEDIENIKLRKKLEVFRNHLPQIQPFSFEEQPNSSARSSSNRVDIATIIKRKNESNHPPSFFKEEQKKADIVSKPEPKPEKHELNEGLIKQQLYSISQEDSLIDTHRQWKSSIEMEAMQIEERQNPEWKRRLKDLLSKKEDELNKAILEELNLEFLIQIAEWNKLIDYFKKVYQQQAKNNVKKPEGIVTSLSSIKDYLNYFIQFIFENKKQDLILHNLRKPLGPSAHDVLKYFRGYDIPYDPDSDYVMSIKFFNQHWEYANQLIYFDPKWEDQRKELQRVNYLKQLTKVFFRAIFDGFNESLEEQRKYGVKGMPYPWNQQRLSVPEPNLQLAFSGAFQRVIRCSMTFCGVHFADKHHNLDQRTMEDIQEENMVKLITMEARQQQFSWNFYEDELVELKLEISQSIQEILMQETIFLLASKLDSRKN